MRTARLVPTLVVMLALSACGTEQDVTEQAPSPSPADTPSAVPSTSAPLPPTPVAEVVQGDGFRITFPVAPSVEIVEVPLDEGLTTEATIYQARVDGAFLGFSHADTPDTGAELDFDPEQALRDSAEGAAENTGGEVAESEIVTFLDRPAIDYLVTVPGGSLRGIAFFDGPRLYTGQLVAEDDAVDRTPLDAMMGSLELL